jgi:small subunit ribosomal protein S8
MITTIRNNYLIKNKSCFVVNTKFNRNFLELLKKNNYIIDFKINELNLLIDLAYSNINGELIPLLFLIKIISKPSWRKYCDVKQLKKLMNFFNGDYIISTSKNLLLASDCIKLNIGGELICQII